jgi:hypothetical protein
MSDLIAGAVIFALGAAFGAAAAWLARADTIAILREQLQQARHAEEVATDRLVHAWKAGATVAPRPLERAIPKPEPLPEPLQSEIDQWEDPETRVMLEARFREGLMIGKSVPSLLLELDNHHP